MDQQNTHSESAVDSRFEERKRDHLKVSISPEVQASRLRDLDQIELIHEALPEINLNEVNLSAPLFSRDISHPFFISSMTAGHSEGEALNVVLAKACARRTWPMGVGSQRRQLFDSKAQAEWHRLRNSAPDVILFGNLGLAQLIEVGPRAALKLAESLKAEAMIVHLNALQEAVQAEGTPQFRGGFEALRILCDESETPIIVKETGCGISGKTALKLMEAGVNVIDVAGAGGTHWGRVEGERSRLKGESQSARLGETFGNWGLGTVDSLRQAVQARASHRCSESLRLWASGGVQNGLDAAKLLALGADRVGFAQVALRAALAGEEALGAWMESVEKELAVALFCTGSRSIAELRSNNVWRWRNQHDRWA